MTQPKKSKRSNQHINHDTIIKDDNLSHTTPCDLSCLNGGYCTFIQYFDYPIPGQSGYYQGCQCPPDYHGGQCELVVEECSPPNYTCSNGAPCAEKNGGYICDCSYADKMSNVAGEMCRDSIVTSCDTRDVNVKSFCMNGGECLSGIDGIEVKKQILDAPSTWVLCSMTVLMASSNSTYEYLMKFMHKVTRDASVPQNSKDHTANISKTSLCLH